MFIKSQKRSQLVKDITKVIQLCAKCGFVVNCINDKNEFEAIRDNFHRVEINITAAKEHVPELY